MLSATNFKATDPFAHTWTELPSLAVMFWKSQRALGGPGGMGQPVPFQALRGNNPVPTSSQGVFLNSRFRRAVRSSAITVGVSVFHEQSEQVLYVRPRDMLSS